MNADSNKINWEEIVSLYNTIKWLYALCEETDSELKTNLQPLNEFRAALDHLMRIVAIENVEEYKGKDSYYEAKKLKSHLSRALYDICDMVSINYRNKIIDALKDYDVEEIKSALPDYYSTIRPRIETISEDIARFRTEGRFGGETKDSVTVDEYPKVVKELQGYYKTINAAIPSLIEIKEKNEENALKEKRKNIITNVVIPIAGIVIGTIIGILGFIF